MKQQFELNVGLTQQLKLTPSVVLSLHLLQLPIVSLEEFLKDEIETNPFIELEREEPSLYEEEPAESLDFIFEGGNVFVPDESKERVLPYSETVYDKLKRQVLLEFEGIDREIALQILNNLDCRGFLLLTEEEIASRLGVSVEKVREVRERFKRLSPAGCGSYSLKESLQVQLEEMGAPEKFITALSSFDFISSPSTFREKTGLTEEEFEELLSYLRRCDTRPGEGGELNVPVKPDARVWLDSSGNVQVEVLNSPVFNFRIDSYYLKHASREELKKFIREKYQRALWLKKAIDQRRETLERVLKELFNRQKEFLKDGKTLKPVTLSEIASSLSIHESTVSRALKDKMVETPFGVYPAAFFLSKHVTSSHQEEIKRAIREIIESEDKKRPYSDSKIAELLKEKGFKVARRTVAKYREEMGIPGAFKRKVKGG